MDSWKEACGDKSSFIASLSLPLLSSPDKNQMKSVSSTLRQTLKSLHQWEHRHISYSSWVNCVSSATATAQTHTNSPYSRLKRQKNLAGNEMKSCNFHQTQPTGNTRKRRLYPKKWLGSDPSATFHNVMMLTVHRNQVPAFESNSAFKPFIVHRFLPGMYAVHPNRKEELEAEMIKVWHSVW